MSEPLDPASAPRAKEDPKALVLRGRPRAAVRFRRGLIVGTAGAVTAGLVALSWLALQPPGFRRAVSPLESDEPARKGGADALANVPNSYGDVPRLGPPLPGDLGRPILEHERSTGGQPSASFDGAAAEAERARAAADAERQRILAARETARTSPVLLQLEQSAGATPATATLRPEGAAAPEAQPAAAAPIASDQQHKIDFARSADGDVNSNVLRMARSPWTLTAGTIIPASLITGLNSDLPGTVLAQVTQNVRDSATGQTILVPQGARLIGRYDSVVAYGQQRALLVWSRLVFPDGSSIQLDNMPATDASGYAGVQDAVDFHSWRLLKGIGLATLLGVGTQFSLGSAESDLLRAVRESTQQGAAHAADQITSRNLEVQPTITVRAGWRVRALVHKDLVLQPWRG
jgi:type IV secretion system protein TrbI